MGATALWCVPRSRSTAMERAFHEGGGLEILHEPFLAAYYGPEGTGRALPHYDPAPGAPDTYSGVRAEIEAKAAVGPVLLKDMSYYVAHRLERERDFFLRLTNTFLVRDPAETVPSYARLDPEVTLDEIGHEALWQHVDWLRRETGRRPVVIDSADLVADPEGILRAYCAATGLTFRERMLDWNAPPPDQWQEVAGWHEAVSAASGIEARPAGAIPDTGSLAPHLRGYIDHHAPFYERLRDLRLRP